MQILLAYLTEDCTAYRINNYNFSNQKSLLDAIVVVEFCIIQVERNII